MKELMPTGPYTLPPLSEYTVTETIYPDPDAKKKMTLTEWYRSTGGEYQIVYMGSSLPEVIFDQPYPEDVEIEYQPGDYGNVYVFSDGKRVEVP